MGLGRTEVVVTRVNSQYKWPLEVGAGQHERVAEGLRSESYVLFRTPVPFSPFSLKPNERASEGGASSYETAVPAG